MAEPTFPREMWHAIAQAETGSERERYIRTRARPKGGSTAFGPVQLTGTTAQDYVRRGLVSPESAAFYQKRMAPMYENFAKYGNEPRRPGYDKMWDYGGTGGFNTIDDGPGYEQLSQEIMAQMWKQAQGRPERFIEIWRGVPQRQDPRYYTTVMQNFKGAQ